MLIPEETIEKIREEADLVEVIGEFVKLEKKGNSFMGLCPFHDDRNPSLSVSPAKKIYKCFSCGASGNVFTFIQNYRNISYPEAVRYVGEKVGIEVDLGGYASHYQIHEKYYKILQTATNFYEFYLKNSSEGKEAREYLYKRKINDEIIKRFRIGLAPREPDLLYNALLKEGYQPLDMIEAGVIRAGENSYYDLFRNRIVFPLEDINGKIVGFSGRIFAKSDEAKYVNSSENKVFKKSRLLYNFFRNTNEIRLRNVVYVFEGFMDVIAAHRAGINHAVAIMGTALTDEQIRALSKVTTNAVVCFDGDSAGIEAAKRAISLFSASGFNVRAALFPRDMDPDDYLNQHGTEKFKALLESAKSGIEYLYEVAKLKFDPKDINSIEVFKNEMFSNLKSFGSAVLTEKFLARLAEDLQVSASSLKEDFRRHSFRAPEPRPREIAFTKPKRQSLQLKYLKTERELLRRACIKKEDCIRIFQGSDCYVDFKNYALLSKIHDYYQKKDIIDGGFLESLKEEEKNLLDEILLSKEAIYCDLPLEELLKLMDEYERLKKFRIVREAVKENPDTEGLSKFAKIRNETVIHKE